MKVYVTASDDAGRSYLETVHEHAGVPGVESPDEVFGGPLALAPGPRSGDAMDIAPAPGEARWRVYDFPPGLGYGLHHTRSVDLDVVIDGSMTLVLDEAEIELHPGDGVLVRGDGHGWRAGERGCRMLIALLGATERPA